MEDWHFITNFPKMNMSKDYILYVDKVDGFGECFTHPQMGIMRAKER